MKIFKEVILRVLVASLLVGSMLPLFETGKAAGDGGAIIIDHTSTNITQIPQWAIEAAKANLHIGYGHLSHGQQLTRGMTGLVAFANRGGKGLSLPTDIFAWNNGGTDGALDLEDGDSHYNGDPSLLGTCSQINYPNWPQTTRDYLDSHTDVNVFMWSWCYDMDNEYRNGTLPDYMDTMNLLEAEYANKPGRAPVKFVYMTGCLQDPVKFTQYYTDVRQGNQMIRDYCNANGKILYDFADIESWDPDGIFYEFADEACNYYSSATDNTIDGNWAQAWRDVHILNVDYFLCDGSAPHTNQINGNLKAYTAWWLWARLAGWSGTSGPPADIQPPSVTVNSPNGGEKFKKGCHYDVTWTATDDVGVASCNISYSTDNGASYTDIATGQANDGSYTWTVPLPASTTCLVKVAAGDAAGNWGEDTSDAIFEICACIPGDADDSGVVNALDITKTERIILGLDSPTEDADANGDTFVNALDITEIEGIII